MILLEKIKEIVNDKFDNKQYKQDMTDLILLLLSKKPYFKEYPTIVYNGFIDENDVSIFENIINKLKDMKTIKDLNHFTLNELYTLSSLNDYLLTEPDSRTYKNDFTCVRPNYNTSTEHYIQSFDYICEAINFKKFNIKEKKEYSGLLGFNFEDFNFELIKDHLLIELKDLCNYKIQNTNKYKDNIEIANNIINDLVVEYPEINQNNKKEYNISISTKNRQIQTFHSIFRSLKSSNSNLLFMQDEVRNFLDLSTLFEISDNIEYITLPYYNFKSDVVFLGNNAGQRAFLKDIAINEFKESFKDKTIVTNSKKLADMEGFHFVSLKQQSQYESFIFLMHQNNHKDYMTKENYKIIFELFNKFNYEEPNINYFKLYDKIHQNIIDTIKDNKNTLKNKVKF